MGKYLVTGGCGFIGSHLCDALLEAGHEVLVLDNLSTGFKKNLSPKAELIEGNIQDGTLVKKLLVQVEGCFHLAALPTVSMALKDWTHYHEANMVGTITILKEAIEQTNIPVVYASSAAIYGEPQALPLTEDMQAKPVSAYGADKYACEMNAFVSNINYDLPVIGLRFFNVYGPRQDPSSPYSGVITKFINELKKNKPITIFGDGKQTRDFVYVADIVKALIQAMPLANKNEAQVLNVCSGKATDLKTLAKTIAKILDCKLDIHFEDCRQGDVRDSLGSTKKAKAAGIVCEHDLESGLRKTLE
jgi:UDP-glucose 4-epimerase